MMIDTAEILTKTKNLKVLFVEDHELLREETVSVLANYFQDVDAAEDGEVGLQVYTEKLKSDQCYDIVITDIQMPKKTGIEMIKEIRELKRDQAVVVLSAYQDSEYLLELIDLGINKFIAKPLVYKEFLQVLYSVSKTFDSSRVIDCATTIELHEGYSYDRLSNVLKKDGEVISLTKNEITILQLLTQECDTVYSANDIVNYFEAIGSSLERANIRNMVSKLRKKFPAGAVESIYGVGYRLNSAISTSA